MTHRPATPAAVLIGVVLTAAASGCAPAASPAPCHHGPRHRARNTDEAGHARTGDHG